MTTAEIVQLIGSGLGAALAGLAASHAAGVKRSISSPSNEMAEFRAMLEQLKASDNVILRELAQLKAHIEVCDITPPNPYRRRLPTHDE